MLLATFFLFTLMGSSPAVTDQQLTEVASATYASHGTTGCFVLYDEQRDEYSRYNAACTRQPVAPASTSKIFNSLIALEEGVVRDEHQVVPWDGVERQFSMWNQDQTLATALQRSAVWVYQHVARTVGTEKMQYWLDRAGYGNGKIGDQVDRFWLDGSLTISPEQQILFLRRLASDDLPFQKRHMSTVRDLLIRHTEADAVLRGKTGWAVNTEPDTGWYVGYLTRGEEQWFFAMIVAIDDDNRGRDRHGMTLNIFRQLGFLQAAP